MPQFIAQVKTFGARVQRSSGSHLTFDSRREFPAGWTHASLVNVNRNSITLKPADRRRLKVLARDRNAPHKYVWRADLFSADMRHAVWVNDWLLRT
jgi:hypothetical protein